MLALQHLVRFYSESCLLRRRLLRPVHESPPYIERRRSISHRSMRGQSNCDESCGKEAEWLLSVGEQCLA